MSFRADDSLIPLQITCNSPSQLLSSLNRWRENGLLHERQVYLHLTAQDRLAQRKANLLEVNTRVSIKDFLAGLNQWQEANLLDTAQFNVQIEVNANNPYLLEGLGEWLELGFLSEYQVKQLCRQNLSCVLAPISSSAKITTPPQPIVKAEKKVKTKAPSRVKQVLQSLMAELSVLWLLLLGVFMIVISSGVIAASLWEQFPAVGQYGVLFVYTVLFWGAGFWARNKPNLRLTTMALRLVSLLLIPMNFLAMDSLGLWQNPLNWVIVGFAALALSFITVNLCRKIGVREQFSHNLPILLGLSYLHWGWGLPWVPIWATYIGVVGTAVTMISRPSQLEEQTEPDKLKKEPLVPFSLNGAIVTYALAILLIRAIFIAEVEITQLGLAIGISGWLITEQKKSSVSWWESLGVSLLCLGWLLSFVKVPWQAIAVSGLGILFVTKRLVRSWLKLDLAILLFIGLQSLWLLWRLIPESLAQGIITWSTRLTGSEATPEALLSVALFPYLIFILFVTEWLSQREKKHLVRFGNQIALGFGIILTLLSLASPALRTINFAATTLTLGTLTQRQFNQARSQHSESTSFPSIPLADFTHITGLITLLLAIDWALPTLSIGIWGVILLLLMVLELGLSVIQPVAPTSVVHLFSKNAWSLGLALGGLSYGLLFLNQQAILQNLTSLSDRPVITIEWGLAWCLAPICLTAIANWQPRRKQVASWLSVASLLLWQSLTFASLTWYLQGAEITPHVLVCGMSLGIATTLMLINTHNLQEVSSAAITIGFGLSLVTLSLWTGIFDWRLQQEGNWLLAGAITCNSFWLFRHRLQAINSSRTVIYAEAFDGWATFLCLLVMFKLFVNTLVVPVPDIDLARAIASGLLIIATAYRSSQSHRDSSTVWFAISILLLAQLPLFTLTGYRVISLAVATGLMIVYVNYLPKRNTALINIGVALTFVGIALWDSQVLSSGEEILLVMACILAILWLLRSWFKQRSGKIATLYRRAFDDWAIVFCCFNLLVLTLHSLVVYWNWYPASSLAICASVVVLVAIAYRIWHSPNNWGIYGIGWSLEIITIEVLGFTEYSLIGLAVANIVLGLVTQIIGDWWHRRSGDSKMLSSWHIIPLFYGALGAVLRWGTFSSWTGFTSLGLVLIALGVGRRSSGFKPLIYLGIVGISISAYEMLFYQIANLSIGDQLLAMAALTTSFVYGYRILTLWLSRYLGLTTKELKMVAFWHWALGSCLLFGALFYPVQVNQFVGLGAGIFLTRYAVFQGRNRTQQAIAEKWVYVGMLQGVAIALYINSIIASNTLLFKYLSPWSGVLVSLLAVALYLLPWKSWGWPNKPWRVVALVLPLLATFGYLEQVNQISLLAVAGFYVWQGKINNQSRWYEITLLLGNLLIIRWLDAFGWTVPFAYTSLLGLSLICFTWIEPRCQGVENKSLRHYLRLLGMGIICGTSLMFYYQTGIIPAIISLIAIFAGLGFRVRAFLYIGTLTFLFDAFYQLVILIFDYPLLKWVVGLMLGLSLLSIAGSFETRKTQITTLLQNWLTQLETWE